MASELRTADGRKQPQVSLLCSICHRPCRLEDCVTDDNGLAVHEKCYAAKVAERQQA